MPARSLLPKPPHAPRNDAEFRLTCAVADHLRLSACPGVVWFHVPNGEARTARTGARLKRMGVRRGVGDFIIKIDAQAVAMLELKAAGGRSSPEQIAFAAAWRGAGGLYRVAVGIDEALEALRSWGALPRDYGYVPSKRRQLPLPIEEVA